MRAAAGAIAAAVVVLIAWRFRSLSRSGAVTAIFFGAIAVAAGWTWGILLLAFFAIASLLSLLGAARKTQRVGGIVAKVNARDAWQVAANGIVFVVAAIGFMLFRGAIWQAVAAGALAASAADTWATEIGTLSPVEPRSIINWTRVPAGTSGAISLPGTLAALGGASFIALVVLLADWEVSLAAVVLGGFAGAIADSLLGATVQEKRWCDVCGEATERAIHSCGAATRRIGGVRSFDNDTVNLACSAIGALVTLALS